MDWNFLIQFCSSDPSSNRNILRSLYLKFETSARKQTAITHYYVLLTNFLTLYEFETYIGNTFRQINLVNDFLNLNFIHVTFSKNVFWSVNCTLFVYQIVNFKAGVKVGISSKKFHNKKYF